MLTSLAIGAALGESILQTLLNLRNGK
jgi:hypothetical protein